jgi:hypothetical protein
MSWQDKIRLMKENGWIGLRLFWVGLRALGTDSAKTHLKATRDQRAEIFRLKGEVRNRLRQKNGELLKTALQDLAVTNMPYLRTLDMDGFMRVLNDGLEPPLATQVQRVPPVTPEAMTRLLDGHAGQENHLVLRTADGRVLSASRTNIGQAGGVEAPTGRVLLSEFVATRHNVLQEIGVIPFTWRPELPARLSELPLRLNGDGAHGGNIESMWTLNWTDRDRADLMRAMNYFDT